MSSMAGHRLQRGGFVLGLIVGLLIGLALSLGVAMYVTKVPVPFVNKVPQRSAEQDATQAEKNRNWDPNAPLAGKNASRAPAAAASAAPAMPAPVPEAGRAKPAPPATAGSGAAAPRKDTRTEAASADRAASAPDSLIYFVQAGAYARTEDAEQQRANLALIGLTARITEREQAGRTVYRVRLGPYERKEDADAAKDRLGGAGIDSALVRVQR